MTIEQQQDVRLNSTVGGALMLCTVIAALSLGMRPARAAIALDLAPVDNSAFLSGYQTFDIQVTTDTDWTVAAMLLELDAGAVYQHPSGADTGPMNGLLSAGVAFDTYVTGNIAGGAGDIDRSTGFAFGADRLDVTWFNIGVTDIGTTTIGRLTLSDDAAGGLSMLLAASEFQLAEFDVAFSPGALPAITQTIAEEPEPEPEPKPIPDAKPAYPVPYLWDSMTAYGDYYPDYFLAPRDPLTTRYARPGYDLTIFDVPTMDARPRAYDENSLRGFYSKPLWDKPTDRRSRVLMTDGHAVNLSNTFYTLPESEPDPLSTDLGLPEPVSGVVLGVCLSGLLLRRL